MEDEARSLRMRRRSISSMTKTFVILTQINGTLSHTHIIACMNDFKKIKHASNISTRATCDSFIMCVHKHASSHRDPNNVTTSGAEEWTSALHWCVEVHEYEPSPVTSTNKPVKQNLPEQISTCHRCVTPRVAWLRTHVCSSSLICHHESASCSSLRSWSIWLKKLACVFKMGFYCICVTITT